MSRRSPDNAIEVYTDSDGYRMTRGEVRQQCSLSGTAKLLGYSSSQELKDALDHKRITEYQIALAIIDARKRRGIPPSGSKVGKGDKSPGKEQEPIAAPITEPVQVPKSGGRIKAASIEELIEGRLAEYAAYFDWEDLAPNNKMSLKRLAMYEVNADILSSRITYLLNTEEYAEDTIVLIGQLRKELVEFNNKIESTEKALGIDITSRENRRQRSTGVEAHKAIVKEAAKWMWQKMTQFVHCGEDLGFGAAYFEGQTHTATCPRCGETITWAMKVIGIQFEPGTDAETGMPKITYLEQADPDYAMFEDHSNEDTL